MQGKVSEINKKRNRLGLRQELVHQEDLDETLGHTDYISHGIA
jgi:hypothetical protein